MAGGLAVFALASAPPPGAQAQQAGDPVAGAKVFASAGCGGCHTFSRAGSTGKVGPNLDAAQPTYDRVVSTVTAGRGVMPAFRTSLSMQQIADVAAFVSGTAPTAPTPGAAPPAPGGRPSGPAPPSAGRLRTTIGPHGLRGLPPRAASGRLALVVRNALRSAQWVAVLRPDAERAAMVARAARVGARQTRTLRLTVSGGLYVVACCARPGRLRPGMFRLLTVEAAGAAPAPAPTAAVPVAPPPSPATATAAQLFTRTCGSCHTLRAAGATGTVGPDLDHEHPSADHVVEVVTNGKDGMPSFAGVLTPGEIRSIADYVAALAAGGGDSH